MLFVSSCYLSPLMKPWPDTNDTPQRSENELELILLELCLVVWASPTLSFPDPSPSAFPAKDGARCALPCEAWSSVFSCLFFSSLFHSFIKTKCKCWKDCERIKTRSCWCFDWLRLLWLSVSAKSVTFSKTCQIQVCSRLLCFLLLSVFCLVIPINCSIFCRLTTWQK